MRSRSTAVDSKYLGGRSRLGGSQFANLSRLVEASSHPLMGSITRRRLLTMPADAVVDAFAGEDSFAVLFYSFAAGGGLFGGVDEEDVAALAAGGEGVEGCSQGGAFG